MTNVIPAQLPADPEEMNDKRAEWASEALKAFEKHGEQPLPDATKEERHQLNQQNLSDLLADFGHYCDRAALDMRKALQTAKGHYDEETDGEGAQFRA